MNLLYWTQGTGSGELVLMRQIGPSLNPTRDQKLGVFHMEQHNDGTARNLLGAVVEAYNERPK